MGLPKIFIYRNLLHLLWLLLPFKLISSYVVEIQWYVDVTLNLVGQKYSQSTIQHCLKLHFKKLTHFWQNPLFRSKVFSFSFKFDKNHFNLWHFKACIFCGKHLAYLGSFFGAIWYIWHQMIAKIIVVNYEVSKNNQLKLIYETFFSVV